MTRTVNLGKGVLSCKFECWLNQSSSESGTRVVTTWYVCRHSAFCLSLHPLWPISIPFRTCPFISNNKATVSYFLLYSFRSSHSQYLSQYAGAHRRQNQSNWELGIQISDILGAEIDWLLFIYTLSLWFATETTFKIVLRPKWIFVSVGLYTALTLLKRGDKSKPL